MLINHELATFMASPVMIVLGTRDGSLVPEIARAVGAFVSEEQDLVELVVSEWQWPKTVANLRANGELAVTFARPSDYVSYQVKGHATAVPVSADHVRLAARYIECMAETLEGLGLERRIVAPWLIERDLITLRLSAQEVYVQTPGAKAGQLVGRQK